MMEDIGTMQIKDMFRKKIDRDIQGVIIVGQGEQTNVAQELEEYVVTRELQKHFMDFFEAYKKGILGTTPKMGVWISGFFGSGKSHFLKILSYLLQNKQVGNKRAIDYFIDDKYEAGIELFGTEVKSIRMGKCSVKEAFVKIDKGQVYIYGMHISPYEKGNIFNKDPLRIRRLLLHKSEIMKLNGKISEKGYTLMPLQVYFKGSLVKVEIGLARGKKLYDKRADIAKKDQRRELEKEFKVRNLY